MRDFTNFLLLGPKENFFTIQTWLKFDHCNRERLEAQKFGLVPARLVGEKMKKTNRKSFFLLQLKSIKIKAAVFCRKTKKKSDSERNERGEQIFGPIFVICNLFVIYCKKWNFFSDYICKISFSREKNK